MSSGIIHDATICVGTYSQYSVGRTWASGREGVTAPRAYGFCGWREDAGEDAGSAPPFAPVFPPLVEVIDRVIAVSRRGGGWVERRMPTLHWLRAHPYEAPQWDDGLDWAMGAARCACAVLGTDRAAEGLLLQPAFRASWEAYLAQ